MTDRGAGGPESHGDLVLFDALDQHPDAIIVTDGEGLIRYVNRTYERRTGYGRDEVVGRTPPFFDPKAKDPVLVQRIRRVVTAGAVYRGEFPGRRKDGTSYPEDLVIAPLRNDDGVIDRFIATCRTLKADDATADDDAATASYYDAVTGLANRWLLNEWAKRALALARRGQRSVALLLLDIDQLDEINNLFGRHTGDRVLELLGSRLQGSLRDSDMLARLEEDMLAVVLNDIPEDETIGRVTERVLANVGRDCNIEGRQVEVSVSVGVALYPRDAATMDELLDCAGQALAGAKRSGTGFEFYQADFGAYTRQRLQMEEDVRLATDKEEFELHFQPIFAAESGEQVGAEALARGTIIGVEALARWPAGGGMISPAEFIPVAETTGRILALDRWALAAAVRQAASWYELGWRGWVSVNLSARSLHDPELSRYVAGVLEKRGLGADHLVIEVTESAAMRDPDATARVLAALQETGIRIAMDDFGVGHSSLAYLKDFPVDLLKLDGSFVRDVGLNAKDDKLIEAIINLAHGIGARIVAEGVERESQLEWLKARGCDFVQGFLVGRPVPPDQIVPGTGR